LAQLLKETDRLSEAEPLMRRALEIDEKSLGLNDPRVAKSLNNLALLLQASGRLGEAVSLVRRALSIDEKSLGPEHPDVATDLNSLATMLQATNQHAEAGAVMRPEVAEATNKLVELLRGPRLREAELLYRRALQIDEKSFGPDHPTVAIILNNLASLLQADSRFAEAEQHYRRALEIDEKSLGPDHRNVAIRLNNMGLLYGEISDWQSALAFFRRASEIIIGHSGTLKENYTELVKAALADNRFAFRHHVLVLHRADVVDFEAREESFQIAQWALQTDAGEALGQMAARFATNHGDLSSLIREQQDLLRDRKAADTDLLSAIGAADSRAIQGRREALAVIETKLNGITERLRSEFSEYAALASPRPLTISGVQALLKQDEVLIQFLDVPSISRLSEEAFAWVLTQKDARWSKLSMPPSAIAERVMALRCGLDRTSWLDASQWPESNDHEKQRKMAQQVRLGRCQNSLAGREAPGAFPPFDLSAAHELYATLLAPFADLIERKRLIIVPSGALTSLPFGVLVTEEPMAAFPKDNAGYRDVAWLAVDHAITVLPSVASLSGLRRTAKTSTADQPFIGFGNPLLQGRPDEPEAKERAELSRQWQHCSDIRGRHQTVAETDQRRPGVAAYDSFFRGPYANVIAIRAQPPLPETAEELCAVARALGVEENNLDRVVYLGESATETAIEDTNEQRGLERYRVLQFATHGVLAGQWRGLAEPGLILTPPKDMTALAKDDGYLSASEISDLKLNADWVVLSACNTAAGQAGNVEALSGLARAFFYAGARALLVSHWAVKTSAAVKLTTGAFSALQAEPSMGRAEAMRRSINTLIQDRASPDSAHPSIWAPFVLVGEGAQL
jgi:CHAT domain-containing protein/tetratricopeptide (TPR) repeat protein